MFYFQQIMVSFGKVIVYIHAGALHFRMSGHAEKYNLTIYHFLTFLYKHLYPFPLFIEVFQTSFLYFIVGFLLVCHIYIAFQIYYILERPQPDFSQYLPYIALVHEFAMFIVFLQTIVDVFLQGTNVFPNTRYADFFIHVEDIFKELHIHIFHFQKVTIFMYHSMINEVLYALLLIVHDFHGKVSTIGQ